MWLADNLKPIGIPPVFSRTASANRRKSSGVSSPLGAAGELRIDTAHACDLVADLATRQDPADPGLCRLPRLEMKRLDPLQNRVRIAEPRRSEFEQVTGILFLLEVQHAPLSGTGPRPGLFRTARQRDLRLTGQRSKAHVRDQ
jgi:hypothetical protein